MSSNSCPLKKHHAHNKSTQYPGSILLLLPSRSPGRNFTQQLPACSVTYRTCSQNPIIKSKKKPRCLSQPNTPTTRQGGIKPTAHRVNAALHHQESSHQRHPLPQKTPSQPACIKKRCFKILSRLRKSSLTGKTLRTMLLGREPSKKKWKASTLRPIRS